MPARKTSSSNVGRMPEGRLSRALGGALASMRQHLSSRAHPPALLASDVATAVLRARCGLSLIRLAC
jgi:hypothetical protein